MKINELEKIVNDGLVKYKAFKDADDVLNQVKGLAQAEEDLKRVVSGLEKTRDSLKAEVSTLGGKLEEAQVKAADILSKAQAQATAAIEAAQDTIAVNQAKADKKLMDTNNRISAQEQLAIIADGKAKEATDKLAAINAELEAAKARMQKVLG